MGDPLKSRTKHYRIYLHLILLSLSIIILLSIFNTPAVKGQKVDYKIYLPLLANRWSSGYTVNEKVLGIYMEPFWSPNNVSEYMGLADRVAGKKHTLSGWFISMQNIAFTPKQTSLNVNNFHLQLESLWAKGYISFVNLTSAATVSAYEVADNCPIRFTAKDIADGKCDKAIIAMADVYKAWTKLGGGRKAFIAPLPEMNGVNADGSIWTSYGGDPANFKLAYQRFITLFAQRGVSRDQAWWTFAPNGWSDDGHEFEKYYPGSSLVDVIGFSSYNYGFCYVANPWERWENYDTLFEPYVERISVLDSAKPIVIAQTGTTAESRSVGTLDIGAKNTWLRDNYEYIASQPKILGVLYFDLDQRPGGCNWDITSTDIYTGYSEGASNPAYKYLTFQDLDNAIP